jgi:hypothetical protein
MPAMIEPLTIWSRVHRDSVAPVVEIQSIFRDQESRALVDRPRGCQRLTKCSPVQAEMYRSRESRSPTWWSLDWRTTSRSLLALDRGK